MQAPERKPQARVNYFEFHPDQSYTLPVSDNKQNKGGRQLRKKNSNNNDNRGAQEEEIVMVPVNQFPSLGATEAEAEDFTAAYNGSSSSFRPLSLAARAQQANSDFGVAAPASANNPNNPNQREGKANPNHQLGSNNGHVSEESVATGNSNNL